MPTELSATSFAVGYAPGKGQFRVYLTALAGIASAAGFIAWGNGVALALAVFFGCASFYFYPLIESERARIGAGEHGIFIEGFGVIPWRAVGDIALRSYAVRTMINEEIQITLSRPLSQALMSDWRSLPWPRLLMRLPWSMTSDNVVHIKMEPFAGTAEGTHARLMNLWRRYRG